MNYDDLEMKIDWLVDAYPHLMYGPGHIVFADYNYEYDHIIWCLDITRYTMLQRLGVTGLDLSHLAFDEEDLDTFDHLTLTQLAETFESLHGLAMMYKEDKI